MLSSTVRRAVLGACVSGCVLIVRPSHGQCGYEFVPVYGPSTPSYGIVLWDISNNGWSGGQTLLQDDPLLVSPEGVVTLLSAPPFGGRVNALTTNGVIVGEVHPANGPSIPAAWVNGEPSEFSATVPISNGYAFDANDNGVVVGFIDPFPLLTAGPCIWVLGDAIPLYEALDGFAIGVSESNEVAGWSSPPAGGPTQVFVWNDGAVSWLPVLPRMVSARSTAMSSNGLIVGDCWASDMGSSRATMWCNGKAIALPLPQGYAQTRAADVNALGQVIGSCLAVPALGLPSRQLLWQDGVATPLFTLLASPFVGSIGSVTGINDRGEICGSGHDGNDIPCGIILRPIRSRPGDVTIDCAVDARDIAALLAFWGSLYTYDQGPGDLDGDRFVGPADLAYVLGDWGS